MKGRAVDVPARNTLKAETRLIVKVVEVGSTHGLFLVQNNQHFVLNVNSFEFFIEYLAGPVSK